MEINHISYSYQHGSQHPNLNDVSFKLLPGSITSLIGPNGSGKSTLFKLLTRQLSPDNGQISINGQDIKSFTGREYAQKIAIVQQQNPLYDDLKVIDLIRFGQSPYHSLLSDEADEQLLSQIMTFLELDQLERSMVSTLSGGQQQRVWLAMALAQQPEYLLLDEPTTYLDLHFQYRFLDLLTQLNQQFNLTILIILHDLNQALSISDRTLLLSDGRLVADDQPEVVIKPGNLEKYFQINTELVQTSAGTQIVQVPRENK